MNGQRLSEIKEVYPEYSTIVHSQVSQDVLGRVDLAYQSFFRRFKNKEGKSGFPRFKSFKRYKSFTYPQFKLEILSRQEVLKKRFRKNRLTETLLGSFFAGFEASLYVAEPAILQSSKGIIVSVTNRMRRPVLFVLRFIFPPNVGDP